MESVDIMILNTRHLEIRSELIYDMISHLGLLLVHINRVELFNLSKTYFRDSSRHPSQGRVKLVLITERPRLGHSRKVKPRERF